MSNIKCIRVRVGLTQASLANDVELTQSAIAHYENGRRSPGLEECRRIVIALNSYGAGVTLDEVFPPEASPTLDTNLRPISTARQQGTPSVQVSSISQASQ